MHYYIVYYNGGQRFVRCTEAQIHNAMVAYIKAMRAKGYSLASIEYCYRRLTLEPLPRA